MAIDSEGRWMPELFPRQWEALEACLPGAQNLILLNGPRWASKTFACHHAVCQHAWNTDRANICLLSITQSVGIDSGIWEHLTTIFLPEWIGGDFGMEWARQPYIQSVTKKPACKVTNSFGNMSSISLESLKNEDEVEERFKGKAYSMIWVNELSKFKKRKTFDTLKQCLRMPHLKTEQHILLADTNPDLDLGAASWIYQLWYATRTATPTELQAMYPIAKVEDLIPLQKALRLIEFTVDDNLSLSEEKKAQLRADFSHDPDLMDAYYWGKWVTASADALFFTTFRPQFHVIGELETPANKEPEIMVPEKNCIELIVGMDPGEGINSAAVIAEKCVFREDPGGKDSSGKELPPVPVMGLKWIDELVKVGEVHSLEEFTIELMQKMEFWEDFVGKHLIWRFWSDRSVLDSVSVESSRYYHQIIYDTSVQAIAGGLVNLKSPIILEAVERGPGTVLQGIALWKMLLFEERMLFSRSKCPKLIDACKSLKRGTTIGQHIQRGSIHKHPWDAARYAAASELFEEMQARVIQNLLRSRNANRQSSLVSVPL